MLRLAAFAVTSALAATAAGPLPPLPLGRLLGGPDHLTVAVSKAPNPLANGTYVLECNPVGGDHPEREAACARLDRLERDAEDPFAPTDDRRVCSLQHGGPAVARITGTWRGQKVDATFRRTNGCEIARWNKLEPVLPPGRS
ncbi:SSI family serine proteinase inhibitor [Streptomyces sp. NPDC046876]|uniref:SSI family serine proteinase inhibitor n=1 Tax=Streptomyces sp. NPDC046876 TaxID=3155616 RepID=UPI0033F0D455